MSSNRRAERRRQQRARHAANVDVVLPGDYAVTVGWCSGVDDLDEARAKLHDSLIAMMGDQRSGPVEWRWWEGQAAHRNLDRLAAAAASADQPIRDHYRRVRAHLREWGGIVVVAMAPGDPA